ncbi:AAA family ATPase [Pseudarthrobacter oxydans]|uniref:AAA family ATPase n=1 Tax=Pseudarthrobacter oxydans TaxID=1671 RepID=UPI00344ED992
MGASDEIRLCSVKATKVLYEYDHLIEFEDGRDFIVIFGPNGIGKTKFLEMIDAIAKMQTSRLFKIPFRTVTMAYSDGTVLTVDRRTKSGPDDSREVTSLKVVIIRPAGEPVTWTTTATDANNFETYLELNTTWNKIGPDLWQDQIDGELAELEELENRLGSRPTRSRRAVRQGPPEEVQEFISKLPTHLIETQRLKIEEYLERTPRMHGRARRPQTTIVEYANQMKKALSDALAENSRITQQLDRTFPNRMLTRIGPVTLSEKEIRVKYESQNRFRSRLAQIALIGLDPELSLPERELHPFEISMLELYLSDADEKLHSFEALLAKIELLEEIINSRLLGKRLHINAHDGLAVRHLSDNREINLDALSSGEQHEIILMFGLLFNVKHGSLVMIDEPEISLHVSWQLKFIDDVRRIAELSGFQFIVATHSPQIINNWWSHAVQLGPVTAEF